MAQGAIEGEASGLKEIRLKDLRPGLEEAVITARVLRAERREVTRRADGGRRPVLSGLLSDGTATVRFTWWDPPREDLEVGTVLHAARFQVREFRGRSELSFNPRTRIQAGSDAELPNLPAPEGRTKGVATLSDGEEGFQVEVRIVTLRPKEVAVRGERRTVFEGLAGDASGSVPFTAWIEPKFRPGDSVRITGTYVRSFRGRPQIVLDQRSTITPIDGASIPAVESLERPVVRRVVELDASGGGERVRAEGVVVGLMPPSGLVYRCPTCRRTTANGHCRVHGSVEGVPDLRARLVLDDGSGAMTVQTDRADTERLLGLTLDGCLAEMRRDPNPARIEEHLHAATFGRRLAVIGRATKDDFGLTFVPDEIVPLRPEPDRALAELRRRLGGGPM